MYKTLTRLRIILIISLFSLSCALFAGVLETESPPASTVSAPENPTSTPELAPDSPTDANLPEPPSPFVAILQPQAGTQLDLAAPLLVSGRAAGLQEGNLTVQLSDSEGNILLQKTISLAAGSREAEGAPWEVAFNLETGAPSEVTITAFAISSEDGSWAASDRVRVRFYPQSGDIAGPLPKIEALAWMLIGFGDENLNPLLQANPVTLQFDPAASRLGGQGGCNNYFADYQLDGLNLVLGPIGATMMMCPEAQMNLETAYHQALQAVAGYSLDGPFLLLTDSAGELLLKFQVDPYSQTDLFSREALSNAIYICQHAEPCTVQLSGGQYIDSATQLQVVLTHFVAFGDLDADGIEEAVVVLTTNLGGSGIFYDLAVVKYFEGDLINTAITTLGDRVQINQLDVVNGEIMVDMLVAGPDDPLCCPATAVIQRYRLGRGELVLQGQ